MPTEARLSIPTILRTSTFLIVLVGILAHGLLILNDGVYWDGWVYSEQRADGNWDALYTEWSDYGAPAAAYMLWLPGYLHSPLGNKLVNFLCLLLTTLMIYLIGKQSGFLSSSESLLVALLSLVYPAFQYAVEFIATATLVPYAAFFVAVYLALRFEESSGWQRWAWRAAALALFFGVAFWLASLLVYYLGFVLLLLAYERGKSGASWMAALPRFVRLRLDFLVLPILFWGMRTSFFAPREYYEDYNSFSISANIFYRVVEFVNKGVIQQFNRTLHMLGAFPFGLVVIGLVVLGLYQIAYPAFQQHYTPRTKALHLLGFGALLFVLGILPYILVGSTPLVEGTKTRFSLLIGLPIALMMVSTIRLMFLDSDRAAPGFMLAAFWMVAFGVATVGYYVEWQARWVHDRSVMTNLASLDTPEDVSVIWVDDHYPLGPDEYYRVYEWSSIFDEAWRDASRIGLAVGEPTNVYVPQRYDNYDVLSDFDASRCQAVLTIQQGPRPQAYNDSLGLSARYLVFRYLMPGQLDDYLSGVTDLEFRRILAPQAANCAAQQAFLEQSPASDALFDPDEAYFLHTNRVADVARLERSVLDAGFDAADRIAVLDAFLPLAQVEPATLEALNALGFDADFYQLYRTFAADSVLFTTDGAAVSINSDE